VPSLLAYVASLRGATTVAQAVADEYCAGLLGERWATCRRHLTAPDADLAAYCDALAERFANPRMQHSLARIASDGSQKIPVRMLPVLRLERDAGRLPEPAVALLAAWILHLRGVGAPVTDVRSAELRPLADGPLRTAVPRLLASLDPALADDGEFVAAVTLRAANP
jgi:fructuronate reductase